MTPRTRADLTRVLKVLVAYAVFAWVLWALLPAIRRTFLLPELFMGMAMGALGVGAVLAGVVAWRYPHMGVGAHPPREGDEG